MCGTQKRDASKEASQIPRIGIEPIRGRPRQILSLVRLPVPPPRRARKLLILCFCHVKKFFKKKASRSLRLSAVPIRLRRAAIAFAARKTAIALRYAVLCKDFFEKDVGVGYKYRLVLQVSE